MSVFVVSLWPCCVARPRAPHVARNLAARHLWGQSFVSTSVFRSVCLYEFHGTKRMLRSPALCGAAHTSELFESGERLAESGVVDGEQTA